MEALQIKPIILFSLLPVWVLVGLFQYLNRFTRKPHFKTWTSGWLFYALFLTLCAVPPGTVRMGWLAIGKNWCIATAALLMLWGSFQFINVPAKQRLIAMMVVFNLMWSCATADLFPKASWTHLPAFAFLALASGFTAFCFFSRRTPHVRKSAALLTLAFSLWSLFLLCSPFLSRSETVLYTGFMAASVLQLFIAVSMMVMVLEETRGKLQVAVQNFGNEMERSSKIREQAETAQENYRLLFENSKDPIAIVSEDDLEILELNAPARKLLGIREPGGGVSLAGYCSIPKQKSPDVRVLSATLPKNPEVELTLVDGVKVQARVRVQRIRHADRRAQQIIFTDVTERSNLARQLRANGKLSALGQVISGVAHELNNPLAAIKGYSDLLLLTSQLDPQTRAALTKVSLESNRAAKLVQDLLAFARPETPRVEPISVNELIERFIGQKRKEVETKDVKLDLDLSPDTEMVLASSDQLQQVLAHLLNNAVEAMEDQETDRAILISTNSSDGKVFIRFDDSGPGIDPNVLPRVFEPFFTTKPVGTGTGLGLSLCYSIILHHKGKISYQPSILGGASFVVELPGALPVQQPDSNIARPNFHSDNSSTGARSRAKLLVVDDEPTVVSLLNDMLSLLGHEVTTFTSPYDALRAIERGVVFDAVLSDFRMPGMTGGDLYERAVTLDPRYRGRFLFLTGDMLDPETSDFFSQNGVPCILKPFQLAALQSSLGELLSSKRDERNAAVANA